MKNNLFTKLFKKNSKKVGDISKSHFHSFIDLIRKNNKEKDDIENDDSKYRHYSENALDDRFKFLNRENKRIKLFAERCKNQLNNLMKRKKSQDNDAIDEDSNLILDHLKNELDSLYSKSQGSFLNIISSIFCQFDKKIFNKMISNKNIGIMYEKSVNDRYTLAGGIFYVAIRAGICTLILLNSTLLLKPILFYLGLCAGKMAFTLYNKIRFGGPRQVYKRRIYSGSYLDNIKNAINEFKHHELVKKALESMRVELDDENYEKVINDLSDAINEAESISNDDSIDRFDEAHISEFEPIFARDADAHIGEIELEQVNNVITPSIANYGNLGMQMSLDTDKMQYIGAYEAIRKSNDEQERCDAYIKLANSYGKNPSKKKKKDIKKLNSYTMMLKNLSLLGHKLRDGTSTKDENANYLALLYRLGKDFDDDYDITDYLSDEYDRYIKDKKEYEAKQKVLKL